MTAPMLSIPDTEYPLNREAAMVKNQVNEPRPDPAMK